MKLDILILNINNLAYSKALLSDLNKQTNMSFSVTLVDQNSSEEGTEEFLNNIESDRVTVIRNKTNVYVNTAWNTFKDNSTADILCYLNNDINITSNFVSDTINIFKLEKRVGIVVHTTNHMDYTIPSNVLLYDVMKENTVRQGWDYSIRREAYSTIPDMLKFYCGDDYLFEKIYENGYKTAYALSSPIIHYHNKSHKFLNYSVHDDMNNFRSLGYKLPNLNIASEYSVLLPTEEFTSTFMKNKTL